MDVDIRASISSYIELAIKELDKKSITISDWN